MAAVFFGGKNAFGVGWLGLGGLGVVRGRGNDAVDRRRRLSGIAQAVAVDEVGGQALQRRPLKDVHAGIEELLELLDGALRRLERAEVARDAAAHRLSGLSTAVAQEGEYLI